MPHEPGREGRADRSFEEIAEEERRKRFPFLYKPSAAQGRYGRDYLGRPFLDASFPWAEEQAGGEAVLAEARIVGEVAPTDRLEVLPEHPVIEECVEWWRSKRGGADPGPFPQTLTPLPPGLPFDRPATLGATYAAGGDFGWLAKEFKRRFRAHLEDRGALEDYDRMKADLFRPRPRAPTVPEASPPVVPAP